MSSALASEDTSHDEDVCVGKAAEPEHGTDEETAKSVFVLAAFNASLRAEDAGGRGVPNTSVETTVAVPNAEAAIESRSCCHLLDESGAAMHGGVVNSESTHNLPQSTAASAVMLQSTSPTIPESPTVSATCVAQNDRLATAMAWHGKNKKKGAPPVTEKDLTRWRRFGGTVIERLMQTAQLVDAQ